MILDAAQLSQDSRPDQVRFYRPGLSKCVMQHIRCSPKPPHIGGSQRATGMDRVRACPRRPEGGTALWADRSAVAVATPGRTNVRSGPTATRGPRWGGPARHRVIRPKPARGGGPNTRRKAAKSRGLPPATADRAGCRPVRRRWSEANWGQRRVEARCRGVPGRPGPGPVPAQPTPEVAKDRLNTQLSRKLDGVLPAAAAEGPDAATTKESRAAPG